MKCLRKYQWVKLPRDIPDMGKGLMAYWAMLAFRAAFRKGNASYCGHSNPVAPGMWAGGVVGLKSILGVRSRTKALQILGELKYLVLILMILVFLSGLGVLLYPYIRGYLVDRQIERTAEEFLSRVETAPISPYPSESQLDQDTPSDSPEPTEPDTYTDLWRDMVDYNKEIYINGQKGLDCKLAYEDPSFVLADYGLESEVFAVISIPALELEMPVFLGANYRHMADGAALLGQTSIPIGGKNTNCIIAGHRGWGGASYFRYVDKLQPGDEVIITNLWETLQYRVAEIQIIQPNEVEQILIKPGQELVTLLTCHPYASGGRQRYLVICERVNENN